MKTIMNIGYMIKSTERLKKVAIPFRKLIMRQKLSFLMFKYTLEFENPIAIKFIEDIYAIENIASITDATTTNNFIRFNFFFFSLNT
jgi:hypothetical protein